MSIAEYEGKENRPGVYLLHSDLLKEKEGNLLLGEKTAVINGKDVYCNESYPDWKKIAEKDFGCLSIVFTDKAYRLLLEMEKLYKKASRDINIKTTQVYFFGKKGDNELRATLYNNESKANETTLPARIVNDVEISIDPIYLIHALKNGSNKVRIYNEVSPIEMSGENYKTVIMPCRLQTSVRF